eukprot:CAMPEP_0201935128 /NCGR_PEP_ID=MMETSP0903-20130614/34901_1 /ASSEMBLY_ACC=CAM_ASM_000552 /TAXON_ID=420261 /ORGANISM="Thalassiosira antarctica, Strain CCMP982" /LENGTH=154 /DNA_ID=CAMNT_0048475489 /DNA_START=60 /DNA_END=521 /DNA_ORIENTATION=+
MANAATNNLAVSEDRVCICGWPTDTLVIDRHDGNFDAISSHNNENAATHTLLLFIPGNPGVIHWYTDLLVQIIKRVGRGFAARGVSYAGHGIGEDVVGTKDDHNQSFHRKNLENGNINARKEDQPKDMSIPWTMEGQVKHKIEWIDKVLADFAS